MYKVNGTDALFKLSSMKLPLIGQSYIITSPPISMTTFLKIAFFSSLLQTQADWWQQDINHP
jgi:hypothetical protein